MLGKWVVKHKWWIIVTTITIVFSASSGIRFLVIQNDNRVFFSEKNPQLLALETLENTYGGRHGEVVFTIAPKDGDVFTRRTLSAVEELTEVSWKMPYSIRVLSIANFQHTRAENDNLIVEDLVRNAEKLSNTDLNQIKQIALSLPQAVNLIISSSGHVAGVFIKVLHPGESNKEVVKITTYARKIADDFRKKYPEIDLYLSGSVIFDNAFGEAAQADMSTLVPLMFIVLVTIIGVALRSFIGTFVTLLIILIQALYRIGNCLNINNIGLFAIPNSKLIYLFKILRLVYAIHFT